MPLLFKLYNKKGFVVVYVYIFIFLKLKVLKFFWFICLKVFCVCDVERGNGPRLPYCT